MHSEGGDHMHSHIPMTVSAWVMLKKETGCPPTIYEVGHAFCSELTNLMKVERKECSLNKLERSSIWNVCSYIGEDDRAKRWQSSLTKRRITIAKRWASETFLTCLVSLCRRLISLACKYTRALVIKRAAQQTSSRFESPASLLTCKWVILMDDNVH